MGTMTLEDARERLAAMIGQNPASLSSHTTSELNNALNEMYLNTQHQTGVLEYRFGVDVIAGEAEYDLPARSGRLLRVTYDNYVLEEKSRAELEREDYNFTTTEGDPWYFYRDAMNDRRIGLYPVPAEASDTFEWYDEEETGLLTGLTFDGDYQEIDGEYGLLTSMEIDGVAVTFDSEYGILIDLEMGGQALECWAKDEPDELTADDHLFQFPDWLVLGIVFAAAAYVLTNTKEERNDDLAALYGEIASEYTSFATRMFGARKPSAVHVVGKSLPRLRDRLSGDTRINVPAW